MSGHDFTAVGIEAERITFTGFEAIIWISSVLPLPFVIFRLFVRYKVFQKVFIDDFLVILAWFILLAFSLSWQVYARDLYAASDVLAGVAKPGPSFDRQFARYLTASVVVNFLIPFCLWSIKFSFLIFFKRLGTNVTHQNVIWWSVTIWNLICFAIFVGVVNWRCIVPPAQTVQATCNTIAAAAFSRASLRIQCAIDVVSECSILLIPSTLLWNVQISFKKKLALAGVFSLTVFTMIASIVRASVTIARSTEGDQTWLYGWAGIEMGVAIIVACLASFRALFTGRTSSRRMPVRNAAYEADAIERRGLARLGLAGSDRSSASLSRRETDTEQLRPSETSVAASENFFRAERNIEIQGGSTKVYSLHDLDGGKVYVRNDVSVSGESR